ncbi:endonuclease I family protein, partial [Peribacillus tepidiphilus]|uniref:endonuclease I family protein n=1 Tax=Peribacillus tepidiphilus TaxID=2652445 RepID=UPI0035B524EA
MDRKEMSAYYVSLQQSRPYYNQPLDQKYRAEYYAGISFQLEELHRLVSQTHRNQLNYEPYKYVYPWVDLQEDGKLKSLYSGNRMEPLEAIEQDLQVLTTANEKTFLFNCEHVVPQSWFEKKQPMRGDLHHLFACEPTCNSRRSNFPYTDFLNYTPEISGQTIHSSCGKIECERFEPEYGKGVVARATLYFLIRYYPIVDKSWEDKINLSLLIEWNKNFPVTLYEKHRNLAIHELQGNRNPFIDFP